MNRERRERSDDETPSPRQDTWREIWETLARAAASRGDASAGSQPPEGSDITAKRMRDLLGSDTPPERPAH